MIVKGFTNRTLKRTDLFGGGIIELPGNFEGSNELGVYFCSPGRHKDCSKGKKCSQDEPRCQHDMKHMVGKTIVDNITSADRTKITQLLRKAYKKCKQIEVTIRHLK